MAAARRPTSLVLCEQHAPIQLQENCLQLALDQTEPRRTKNMKRQTIRRTFVEPRDGKRTLKCPCNQASRVAIRALPQ
jgi:hypothetical protein